MSASPKPYSDEQLLQVRALLARGYDAPTPTAMTLYDYPYHPDNELGQWQSVLDDDDKRRLETILDLPCTRPSQDRRYNFWLALQHPQWGRLYVSTCQLLHIHFKLEFVRENSVPRLIVPDVQPMPFATPVKTAQLL